MLLLAKLIVTPALVWLTGWIQRRFGGVAAGMLAGFPVMTAPVAFFMALEQGAAFGAQSAVGILLALPGVTLFATAYALSARRLGWQASVAIGVATYFAVSFVLVEQPVGLAGAAALALAMVALGLALVPAPRADAAVVASPWWDIWLRMAVTAAIVLAVTGAAGLLGPRLSSIPATYPAITSVIVPFAHARGGRGAAERLLRGMLLSHISFVLLFVIVGATVTRLGVAASYGAALAAALACSALVIAASRRLATRHAAPSGAA